MASMKFMLFVAAVLVTALATNANDTYEAVDVDAISSTHSKGLGGGNIENEIASWKNSFKGRKFGGKAKNMASIEEGYGKKETIMKEKVKDRKKDEDNDSGFVAFNVDYHAPRHHPPKNN